MAKVSMCRVCLGEDVRLNSIVGTHLQEMYESLVLVPLETTDGRPVLVCYICCARLKNCYKLRKSCLQSEELFTQMLNSNELTLQEIANKVTLTMHNVIHLSMGHKPEKSADNVAVEALKYEVKYEQNDPEGSDEDAVEENNVSDCIQSSDSDDDPLIIVKEEQSSDLTLKKSNEASPRSPEHFSSERVQYTCDACQQSYSSKCELERHIRVCSDVWKTDLSRENSTSAHTAQDPHQCNICEKQFSIQNSLRTHMRSHTGEKPFHCDICKKQFSIKTHLNTHVRTHTGEKPYHCDICKKHFSQSSHLKMHVRTHTGEKPYNCGKCKKQFSVKTHLNRHIRTHTGEKPFHCKTCNKQFSDKSVLNRHMRIHTGEKPYHCGICKKQFSQRCQLNKHMRTYTGEKPFN